MLMVCAQVVLVEVELVRRRLAAGNPAAYEPDLARSLKHLSIRLAAAGRGEEADRAGQEVAEIERRHKPACRFDQRWFDDDNSHLVP
jgi:hypothetical protein